MLNFISFTNRVRIIFNNALELLFLCAAGFYKAGLSDEYYGHPHEQFKEEKKNQIWQT